METKTEYKSPKHKLLSFFEKSRDEWKIKTKEGKHKIQLLKNRVIFLEKSRGNWREEAKALKEKLNNRKLENDNLQKEIDKLKKNH